MKPTLNESKEAEKVYSTEIIKLSNLIKRLEAGPKIKSMVGKYYKYNNSVGLLGHGWTYFYIKRCVKNFNVVYDSFREDPKNEIVFIFNEINGYFIFYNCPGYIEISKKEYLKVKKALIAKLIKSLKKESK